LTHAVTPAFSVVTPAFSVVTPAQAGVQSYLKRPDYLLRSR
jgi:hypothetical protein